jgi:hypothetical protein
MKLSLLARNVCVLLFDVSKIIYLILWKRHDPTGTTFILFVDIVKPAKRLLVVYYMRFNYNWTRWAYHLGTTKSTLDYTNFSALLSSSYSTGFDGNIWQLVITCYAVVRTIWCHRHLCDTRSMFEMYMTIKASPLAGNKRNNFL